MQHIHLTMGFMAASGANDGPLAAKVPTCPFQSLLKGNQSPLYAAANAKAKCQDSKAELAATNS